MAPPAPFLSTLAAAAAIVTPSPPNKRRRSDMGQFLGLNVRLERNAAETSTQHVLNEVSVELDEDKTFRRHKKAREAVAASRVDHFTTDDDGAMCAHYFPHYTAQAAAYAKFARSPTCIK
jgi:hypothetical protein